MIGFGLNLGFGLKRPPPIRHLFQDPDMTSALQLIEIF